MKSLIISSVLSTFAITTVASAQTTYTVALNGSGDFFTIQGAVDAATDGDTVLVMPGTYYGLGDEVVDINGKNISLISSAGHAFTFIDAENSRRGITCVNNNSVVIAGFTIRNGYVTNNGGGMLCQNSSPEIRHCDFYQNTSEDRGGALELHASQSYIHDCSFSFSNAQRGGAIHAFNSSVLDIEDCVFSLNAAELGGGIYTSGGIDGDVVNCEFQLNQASAAGGGMYMVDTSDPSISNCEFYYNMAPNGDGGGICTLGDSAIEECTFESNFAYKGGGMYMATSTTTIVLCEFFENEAEWGGGLYCVSSNLSIEESNFNENSARIGGGLYCSGAILTLDSCDFNLNTSSNGGGAFVGSSCVVEIINCNFISNVASNTNGFGHGGGLSVFSSNFSSSILLTDTLFENNLAFSGAGLFLYFCGVEIANCTIINNHVQLNNGAGGIRCDYSTTTELANTIVCDNTPNQIIGSIIDSGGNTIGTGCSEPSSDVDGDGDVDISDLLAVIVKWGTDDPHVDLDADGVVYVSDVLIVVSEWSHSKKNKTKESKKKRDTKGTSKVESSKRQK
ncbi:MAG TPA: hypothetical protein EYN32_03645 [Phycisphaerales bacterium]|nr:hypothetical protein [Phycisphaerales bacterium]